MPSPTSAERKAIIKARLKAAETPQKDIDRVMYKPPPESDEDYQDEPVEEKTPKKPSSGTIAKTVKERRKQKPTNYKIHVVTALGLALLIRVTALGGKAVVGGK